MITVSFQTISFNLSLIISRVKPTSFPTTTPWGKLSFPSRAWAGALPFTITSLPHRNNSIVNLSAAGVVPPHVPMGIVLFGASHGLLFLPALLSYVGAKCRYDAQLQNDNQNSHSKRGAEHDPLLDRSYSSGGSINDGGYGTNGRGIYT